ncbi:sulfotransferase domain-containing protein [Mycobacterium helveticum]|uniref:Sulfotransferase domain-containing protein n=1 Tax=Mycobacterium helveticum TaxID=2592811 RepID=A0A557XXU3_9MYCO|nr:sulfotransferase domain-containing protein [Mycobacterium helveticum]TVS87001.1 sulfotransferase domain-containing protein [Mycobacterium helveticum]TVS90967.1 sulfotransferase domain-containing protein [Mycobacterium helveticum]
MVTTPNVLLIHYQNLTEDLPGQIKRVADFLSVDLESTRMNTIVQNCSFGRVSGRVEKTAVVGAERISSTNRIPGDHARRPFGAELPPPLIERFDRIAVQKLGSECAQWLEAGRNG